MARKAESLIPKAKPRPFKRHGVRYDKERGSSCARGYDRDWQRLRLVQLGREPLCRHCKARHLIEPAVEVDHIVPIKAAPELRLDIDNLQSLCKSCHARKTLAERKRLQDARRATTGTRDGYDIG
jgi:5-methylcytosine-specific restriction protein A